MYPVVCPDSHPALGQSMMMMRVMVMVMVMVLMRQDALLTCSLQFHLSCLMSIEIHFFILN
jgi:hypothetical protein